METAAVDLQRYCEVKGKSRAVRCSTKVITSYLPLEAKSDIIGHVFKTMLKRNSFHHSSNK
jgi:hypothetical protein